jgi:AraC family transcriptional regulator, regulatory protein of adaptative response / methylated-DNA-[protein]-cysteine methyltransferase
MEQAFMARDGSYDGLFYAAVTTTGIFCRPSCPAKKAKNEHLEFFASAKEALFAGFRPCARCRPLDGAKAGERENAAPLWVRGLVDRVEADPSRRIPDAELAAEGIDATAARRWFLRNYGMTFQAYCRARRLGAAFQSIKEGADLDDAVFDHGWESHSAFRDAFSKAVGLPPGAARGTDFIRLAWIETPLGPMVAGATETAVCLLEFSDRRMMEAQLRTVARRLGKPLLPAENPLIDSLRNQLAEYFAGARRTFDLPLDYPGTDFQRRVWEGLMRIPYGETRSYAQLAAEIGADGASRAVGTANGLNRIAILIPCHRVIAADGGLGGYGGGLWRKLRLLEREGAAGALNRR